MRELETTATLELNGNEYTATVYATVYPAQNAENGEKRQEMRIEIDAIDIGEYGYFSAFFERYLGSENYNRCLLAVQNEIEK